MEGASLLKRIPEIIVLSNKKFAFNSFLYECNFHKLKAIQDILHFKVTLNNELQILLHEVIKNGYLNDLITCQHTNKKQEEKIKRKIHYNENNPNELKLNGKLLTILNGVKKVYHNDIHKHIGYPLQLHEICAILLHCGTSCNFEFGYDQITFKHCKWPYLDNYLQSAINTLHKHERREENEMELYCKLKDVRLENIEKKIKAGYFISHVSASDNLQIIQIHKNDHYDLSWISPREHEREILF
ncbi:hypothetical protein RFI_29318, partial [Reticulomyxa filosa]